MPNLHVKYLNCTIQYYNHTIFRLIASWYVYDCSNLLMSYDYVNIISSKIAFIAIFPWGGLGEIAQNCYTDGSSESVSDQWITLRKWKFPAHPRGKSHYAIPEYPIWQPRASIRRTHERRQTTFSLPLVLETPLVCCSRVSISLAAIWFFAMLFFWFTFLLDMTYML